MRTRALAAAILSFGLVASTFACRPPISAHGYDCNDPRIDSKIERLLVGNSPQTSERARAENPYLMTADEAKAVLANPTEPQTGAAGGGDAHPTIEERVAAFIEKTDFSREKLMFSVIHAQGDDGFIGAISSPGQVTLLFHTCSQMGGDPPPSLAYTAVIRVPKDARVTEDGCGTCPPVVCCPP